MKPEQRDALEHEIRRRAEAGDTAGATTVALRGYGSEIFGFLSAFQKSEQAAEDVFSDFTVRVWKGLPRFAWQSSFRTWAYTVARNASLSYQSDRRRNARRHPRLPEGSALSAIAQEVRTRTLTILRTEGRSRAAALRASLSTEDQELLVLRVDREMAWNDLAQVLHGGDAPLGEADVKREAARLRKRFQSVKERLVELARRNPGAAAGRDR